MVDNINKYNFLAEGVDFIEEAHPVGKLEFTSHDPNDTGRICEGLDKKTYRTIGVAEGTFFVLNGVSRNNRFYPEEFWREVALSEDVQSRVSSRRMVGTIGHRDRKVTIEDFAKGDVSHIVTDLKIVEGSNLGQGRLEILDTESGRRLKALYEAGVPLAVSSRGGGKLKRVPGDKMPHTDASNYFLETFDVVLEPGFVQAKPVYVGDLQETSVTENEKLYSKIDQPQERHDTFSNENNEVVIKEEKELMTIETINSNDGQEALIKKLLNPLAECAGNINEGLKKLAEADLSEKKALSEEVTDLKGKLSQEKEAVIKVNEEKEVLAKELEEKGKILEAKEAELKEISETKTEVEKVVTELMEKAEQASKLAEGHKVLAEEKEALIKERDEAKVLAEETKKELDALSLEVKAKEISEEYGITLEEVKTLLADKTVEQIKEEKEAEKEKDKKEKEEKAKVAIQESLESSNSLSGAPDEDEVKPFNRFVKI
jgi:hypothetical protein